MLLQLRIKNFAVIDDCLLKLGPGLVAMTGETGAGKSIIVDALSACLGGRVGTDMVRHGSSNAEVEAVFSTEDFTPDMVAELAAQGLEADENVLILSRDIQAAGRGVARVNGRAAVVATLGLLAERLVDLHGQSEHLSLLKPARQLDLLDHFAGLDETRKRYADLAEGLNRARRELADLKAGRQSAEQRLDLLRFQVQEIDAAKLQPEELEELAAERTRLANAEKLAALATQALLRLQGDDTGTGAVEGLVETERALVQLSAIDSAVGDIQSQAEGLRYQAEDIASAVRGYRDQIEFDPRRLDDVESRLDEISRLQRKYGSTIDEILAFGENARGELELVEDYDERLDHAEAAVVAASTSAGEAALALSDARRQAAERFASATRDRLARLALGPARFEIGLERSVAEDGIGTGSDRFAFTSSGIDRIQFLVSFNAGEPLKPIEKVASGGETARFMLAVKSVLAGTDDVATLVFDEIDTGVGGRSGHVVAAMLHELAQSHQVIAITHLPQIAARADQHIKVVKTLAGERTAVAVVDLDARGRVQEVAEMLGGASPGEAAIRNAQELLSGSHSGSVAT